MFSKYFTTYYLIFAEHIRMMISYLFIQNIKTNFKVLNKSLRKTYVNLTVSKLKAYEALFRKICNIIRLFNVVVGLPMLIGIFQCFAVAFNYSCSAYVQLVRHDSLPKALFFFVDGCNSQFSKFFSNYKIILNIFLVICTLLEISYPYLNYTSPAKKERSIKLLAIISYRCYRKTLF